MIILALVGTGLLEPGEALAGFASEPAIVVASVFVLSAALYLTGAPAFLVASAVLQQAGRQGLGIFSIAPIGLAISALGTLYMMTIGRLLLPERQAAAAAAEKFRLDDYFTELTVLPDSPFLDKT